ncbi:MAG: hypothetical protein M0022_10525 [Desulfobacteraceae bacterium]|nr:hypothetical protein [Desulfobacteraceae bacterium]
MQKTFIVLMLSFMAAMFTAGCSPEKKDDPTALLNTYFGSAVKQDYATTYTCYYLPYKEKISKDDFIKHRKEASVLQSYRILSVNTAGDTAKADVQLTFAASEKFHRQKPVTINVTEDMIKEPDGWKIKVW